MVNFEKAAQALRVKAKTQAAAEPANFTAALEAAQHRHLKRVICGMWRSNNDLNYKCRWVELVQELVGMWSVVSLYEIDHDVADEILWLATIASKRADMMDEEATHA